MPWAVRRRHAVMRGGRALLVCALASLAWSGAAAQGSEPFRKTDLVRLLTAGPIPADEIAVLVRRNCLTFQPTARDRADLRTAGATDAVFAAMDQCARKRSAGGAAGTGGTGS